MTARERALAVFRFEGTDRPCFDLMEGTVWPKLGHYLRGKYGALTNEAALNLLDADFRWSHLYGKELPLAAEDPKWEIHSAYSDAIGNRLLADAHTAREVDRLFRPDPAARPIPDFRAMRAEFPDKALVCCIGWTPIFSCACEHFGIEGAMIRMAAERETYKALAIKQSEYLTEYTRLSLEAGAAEACDFIWFGDDFSYDRGPLISPAMYRELIKPYQAPALLLSKSRGLRTLFHSCGACSELYEDFIDIGIDCHIGVQTSGDGMGIHELAAKIGGRLVIFGGVDAQTTLVDGTPGEVRAQTLFNMAAFRECGGYIVSNSHHGLPDIRPENVVAMAEAAGRDIRPL